MTIKEGVESAKVNGPGKPMTGKTSVGGKLDDQINKPIVVANSSQEVAPTIPTTHLRKSSNELEIEDKISNGSKGSTPSDEASKPIAAANNPPEVAPTTPPTHLRKSSNRLEKVAKISNGSKSPTPSDEASKHVPHYLRPSTSSCHHYCKYGVKPEKSPSESSDASKHLHSHAKIANQTPLAVPKSAVPKTPKGPKSISGTPSPVGPSTPVKSSSTPSGSSSTPVGHSSIVSSKEKTAVDKSASQAKVVRSTASKSKNVPYNMPSKPSSERKTKASGTPKPAINGNGNAKMAASPSNHAVSGHDNAKKAIPSHNHALNGHDNTKKAIPSYNHALNIHGNAKKVTPPSNHVLNGHSNAKTVPRISDKKPILKTKEYPLKKAEKKVAVKFDSPRSQSPTASLDPQNERANRDGTVEVCSDMEELCINDQICATEDVHQFDENSHITDETCEEEHAHTALEDIDNEGYGQSVEEYCNECGPACVPCESIGGDEYANEKNNDFETYEERNDEFKPYGESLADEYVDEEFDSEYSEEYSEYSESPGSESDDEQEGPHKVRKQHQTTDHEEGSHNLEKRRFRRGQIIAGSEEDNQRLEKRRFRRGRIVDSSNTKPEPENVNLRHQELQARKASEDWMLNHVIEKEVNKLASVRKSKVKTLVGAFETVISLKESETSELKHVSTKDVSQMSTLDECS